MALLACLAAGAAATFAAAANCGLGSRVGAPEPRALTTGVTLEARLLLVAADGHEAALAAMQRELDSVGTPYKVVKVSDGSLSPGALSDSATHGLYDGVIVAGCAAGAGPDAASDAVLAAYASSFGVREACLYSPADAAHGLGSGTSIDTHAAPLALRYTPAGQTVFGGYVATTGLEVSGVAASLGTGPDADTTPLLVDDAGNVAAATRRLPDGREMMLFTFDQAPGASHSIQLLYGVAVWVARGVFIGEKRAYFGPQVDDLFLGTVMEDGTVYRMSGDELRGFAAWQQSVRATPVGAGLRVTFAFNGAEVRDADELTQAARDVGQQFLYVTHTYDHHRLDYADGARMTLELTQNDAVMQAYGFGPYDRTNLVTPDVSGLANAAVMQAAAAFGIAQLVCDASQSSCAPSVPNTGLPNPLAPSIFMIPRLATNLYATVSTPAEWTASYNARYPAGMGGARTVAQIVDVESDHLLGHLLAGDIAPSMFHQANLRAYDGTRTLFGDLVDRLLVKYAALRVLPVVSVPMEEIARRMQDRGQLGSAGLTATIVPGQSIVLRAAQAVRVPVTGARGPNAESYGGAVISRVDVPAGGEVTLPLASAAVAGAADAGQDRDAGLGAAADAASVKLTTTDPPASSSGGCALAPPARPVGPGSSRGADALAAAALALAAALARRRKPGLISRV